MKDLLADDRMLLFNTNNCYSNYLKIKSLLLFFKVKDSIFYVVFPVHRLV